ncbi:PPE family protein [Mycobacterium sp.]|uniref:PPE family protein n=1 Tax=Mycobacterium sp. TaxID=1785 RepID=UPI003A8C5F3C
MTSPHFAWLPPEINSALMFAGPGAGPLVAAATAWGGLAEELASSVASFTSVTQELTTSNWLGPSAVAMMSVATQYMSWLSAAAAQADLAASQAAATASVFEAARAATVLPAVVEANRGLVQMLASTNLFGMNWPAIMDTESAYEQMWALDVAAMANYHLGASEAAAQLEPWQEVLRNLGIDIGENGQLNLGFNNTGTGNFGNENVGSYNTGSGNTGSGNVGSGNTGSGNVGTGNTGNSNVGFGNVGSGNFGFANAGNNSFGFGLTGDHQLGFGGFESSSAADGGAAASAAASHPGIFSSGTGSVGLGSSFSADTGLGLPAGADLASAPTPWGAVPVDSALTADMAPALITTTHYTAGGLGAAALNSGLLNSAVTGTGGLSPALTSTLSAAPLVAPAASVAIDSSAPSPITANPTSSAAANAGLRTTASGAPTGFYESNGSAETGVRAPLGREPGLGNPSVPGADSPGSNVYPLGEDDTGNQSRIIQFPIKPE